VQKVLKPTAIGKLAEFLAQLACIEAKTLKKI